jgi:hypothetical protein
VRRHPWGETPVPSGWGPGGATVDPTPTPTTATTIAAAAEAITTTRTLRLLDPLAIFPSLL